ncbi:hypothetical protein E2P81_ATG10828 [Venturia nashicola]|nr:hypothetical protein E2P81_ATG10828 [Venturia nashicola]
MTVQSTSMHNQLPFTVSQRPISTNELYSLYMAMDPIEGLRGVFDRLHSFAADECNRFFTPDEFGSLMVEERRRNAHSRFIGFQPVDHPPPLHHHTLYLTSFITRWLRERCETYTMMPFISSRYYALYRRIDMRNGNLDGNTDLSQRQEQLDRKAQLTKQLFAEEHFPEWIKQFVCHVIEDDDAAVPRRFGLAVDLWRTLYPLMRPNQNPDLVDFGNPQFIRLRYLVIDFVLYSLRLEAEPAQWHWHWPQDREKIGERTCRNCSTPGISKVVINRQPGNVPIELLERALPPRGTFLG